MYKLLSTTAFILALATPAKANLLQATFTGVVAPGQIGFYFGNNPDGSGDIDESTLWGKTFTAIFNFDTAQGVLTQPSQGMNELAGGLLNVSFTIPNTWSFGFIDPILTNNLTQSSILDWSDDLATIHTRATDGYFDTLRFGFGSFDFFQNGTCPGRPCGFLQVNNVSLVDPPAPSVAAPVPLPLAGTGLPGLMLLALFWLRRRKPWALGPSG